MGIQLFDDYRVAVGGDNIFNRYIPTLEVETLGRGNARPRSNPFDYSGTHEYIRFVAELF